MLDFCITFNNDLFQKFEIYFRIPTLEECYDILDKRKNEKIKQMNKFAKMAGI